MRGLRRDRDARIILAGDALALNVRRGHYELAAEAPANRRVAVACSELAPSDQTQAVAAALARLSIAQSQQRPAEPEPGNRS
jgi:hypothetical protein